MSKDPVYNDEWKWRLLNVSIRIAVVFSRNPIQLLRVMAAESAVNGGPAFTSSTTRSL
jgi:hypothetical protein